MTSIEQKILEKENEIALLKEQLKHEQALSDDEKLAIQLHGMLCTWNHVDGCSWEYEIKNNTHDWNGHAHCEYLKKAVKLKNKMHKDGLSVSDGIRIFKIVKSL
jgi:hypothetical protein